MCKFYSAIVMKNGDLLHNENLMSHEDIIDLFNINDSQTNCNKFVRVEFSPDNDSDLPDISKYKLNVDESTTPNWFGKHREYVTERLTDIVKNRIISGSRKLLIGGLYVVKDAEIGRIKSAIVVYLQNSQVNEMRENSQVNVMWGNSQVNEMWGNSQVNVMWGNSQVNEMLESSQVNEMWGNSTAKINNSKNKLPR